MKVLDMEQNRKNRLTGKPFKIAIDTKTEDFFFPANASEEDLDRVLNGLSHKNHQAIYLYCSSANYSIFNAQFLNETEKVSRDTCPGLKSIKYYILNKSDRYCYQVFYISGKWIKGLAITAVQKNVFRDKLVYIKDTSSPVSVFLLNKILDLREVQGEPLTLWRQVPGIFD
ncbi:hypothetical protein [Chitinophaga qingshengii]|uniref:Uncharacterized protein n=1 Tax=Chitinophaga qingshengii TaxID=1569794 RepID=A0ABR7TKY9_9BACT|nr:hypothetical protein [Chitinophaga qingshengii]MBC9930618.1 hypothetical protein [Chitinophaga qingshengii]